MKEPVVGRRCSYRTSSYHEMGTVIYVNSYTFGVQFDKSWDGGLHDCGGKGKPKHCYEFGKGSSYVNFYSDFKTGDNVQILSGEHKDKVGIVVGDTDKGVQIDFSGDIIIFNDKELKLYSRKKII